MHRVVRPGGRVVALEITHPGRGAVGCLARFHLRTIVPQLGRFWGDDRAAYRYLPASLDTFPDAERLAEMFRAAGFADVGYRRLNLGCVAIHVGRVPED
jgi:demethylmenaquinone methyltransferase/2-methoxy-6-polyprenyl-1,4-benzoquinol methylase